jgi:predicted Rossmann-fold nucleotide-binding protein
VSDEHLLPSTGWLAALRSSLDVAVRTPTSLYTRRDLASCGPDGLTFDAAVHRFVRESSDEQSLCAFQVHDARVNWLIQELATAFENEGTRRVAVLGGHSLSSSSPLYGAMIDLGHRLARRGYVVVTEGGGGAMEAASLGSVLKELSAKELAMSLARLDTATPAALGNQQDALGAINGTEWSKPVLLHGGIAISSWNNIVYQAANLMPALTARFMYRGDAENSVLEFGRHGTIIAPGGAGTMQELFQAITRRVYARERSEDKCPLILFGSDYWRDRVPTVSFLQAMLQEDFRRVGNVMIVSDDTSEIVDFLEYNRPR